MDTSGIIEAIRQVGLDVLDVGALATRGTGGDLENGDRHQVIRVRRSRTPIWRKKYSQLTVREKVKRRLSLEVLQRMRRKRLSLTKASRELGVSRKTVKRHVGTALVKKRGRLILGRDRVSRAMTIYESGQEKVVEVPDFQTASNIGKYHSFVKRFLETGDVSILHRARGIRYVRDTHRKTHELELRPHVLYQIAQRRAEPEFFQIYHE